MRINRGFFLLPFVVEFSEIKLNIRNSLHVTARFCSKGVLFNRKRSSRKRVFRLRRRTAHLHSLIKVVRIPGCTTPTTSHQNRSQNKNSKQGRPEDTIAGFRFLGRRFELFQDTLGIGRRRHDANHFIGFKFQHR